MTCGACLVNTSVHATQLTMHCDHCAIHQITRRHNAHFWPKRGGASVAGVWEKQRKKDWACEINWGSHDNFLRTHFNRDTLALYTSLFSATHRGCHAWDNSAFGHEKSLQSLSVISHALESAMVWPDTPLGQLEWVMQRGMQQAWPWRLGTMLLPLSIRTHLPQFYTRGRQDGSGGRGG